MALVNSQVRRFEAAAEDHERTLVDRARAMDPAAWDDLYTQHYAAIRRYAHFRLGDATAAEDIAAEVFLQALRGIGKYRYRGIAFRAWLYRIAHNLTANHRRKMSTRLQHESPGVEANEQILSDDFAPALQRERDLKVAVAKLTDEQQQVVILRFFEGLSLAETAEVMARKNGAIKSLQHRALQRLRVILGEDE